MNRITNYFVSVIIPTYNRGSILLDTINQVLVQRFRNFELIIVDQTDNDEYNVSEKIRTIKDERIKLFSVSPNSLPAARNFGLRKAKGDIVVYIDDDVKIKKDFLDQHLKGFLNKDIVAVAGSVTQENHPHYDFVAYFDRFGMQHGLFNYKKSIKCTTFPGGNVSLNRSAVIEAGGFDESYTGSAIREESDLAVRLNKIGTILFKPKANIFHLAVPFGGCRVYRHQYSSLQFYYNNFRFIFKTVQARLLPISLYKCYIKFCLDDKDIRKIFYRTLLYAAGIVIAIKRIIFPVKIRLYEK